MNNYQIIPIIYGIKNHIVYCFPQLLNFVFNTNKNKVPHDYDNENENENQEEVELEKYILSEEENEFFSKTTLSSQIRKDINDESDEFLFDSLKSEVCSFLPVERDDDDDDYLSHEIFGFGANKKVHNIFCPLFL